MKKKRGTAIKVGGLCGEGGENGQEEGKGERTYFSTQQWELQ